MLGGAAVFEGRGGTFGVAKEGCGQLVAQDRIALGFDKAVERDLE